jgi:uncharacterized protein
VTTLKPPHVFILPGLQGSGPDHWQSRWEVLYGFERVQQHDWHRPLRGDWLAQLEEAVLRTKPGILVAHGLACMQVAAWASFSRHAAHVPAALLVAPVDVEQTALRAQLPSWAPVVRQGLPFRSCVVFSENDVFCAPDRARAWARDWGAECVSAGAAGHLNADSGLGDWPWGLALLHKLMKDESTW